MRLRIHQLSVRLAYGPGDLKKAVCRKLRCSKEQIHQLEILRRSIDARKKEREPRFVFSVEVEYSGKPPHLRPGQIEKAPRPTPPPVFSAPEPDSPPPVVIGAGPAGLMTALTLAEAGYKPLLIERGAETPDRESAVRAYWNEGVLDPENNVLYGEGGAGLFSDGKLTARTKDRERVRRFFAQLVECGASEDILIDAMPHIGSDRLAQIIPALRNRIWERGGACAFNSRLEDFIIEDGRLRGVVVSGKTIRTDACFLATGHSARDVYNLLFRHGVSLEPKPFAVGVRLEIPQHRIDEAQYGSWVSLIDRLGHASFRLTRREEEQARRCYSFCMCPGGEVISCASSDALLTSNGMSLSRRDEPFGNAAFLVPVEPTDFPQTTPTELAGIAFQQQLEQAAFEAGGGTYALPAQRLTDFLANRKDEIPAARSAPRAVSANLHDILPDFIRRTLRSALPKMLEKLPGVLLEEALLYGNETRSSSPLRILRSRRGESLSVRGLYPCGEGSGYAGGIVSSAIDAMRIAEEWLLRK